MPKEIDYQFHALSAVQLNQALDAAQDKYQYSILTSKHKLEKRKPKNITNKNVHVKLLSFLLGPGGVTQESYKFLTLSELFNITVSSDKQAQQLVGYDFLNCQDENGNTILHKMAVSAIEYKSEIFKLLEYKPDLSLKNKVNKTAFIYLLNNRVINAQLVMKFLEGGADVNTRNRYGSTISHLFAIQANDFQFQMYKILKYKPYLGLLNIENKSAFAYLLDNHELDYEIVMQFLESGADINTQNKFGDTLLHILCTNYNNFFCLFEELLNRFSVDLMLTNIKDKTALHILLDKLDYEVDSSMLATALLFIRHGKNVNANIQSKQGKTLLHFLASHKDNYANEISFLINQRHANVLIQDSRGRTALEFAEETDHANVSNIAKLRHPKPVLSNLLRFFFHQQMSATLQKNGEGYDIQEGNTFIENSML